MSDETTYKELEARAADISALYRLAMLLFWDQRTIMPPGGAQARSEHIELVVRLRQEQLVSDEMGRLLEDVRTYERTLDPDSDEAALIRFVRRDHRKASKVPPALAAEMQRSGSEALPVWDKARRENDFASFLPHLRRNVELRQEYVACFRDDPEFENDYDVLLDDYEPGMQSSEVRSTFDELKEGLVPLIAEIAERAGSVDDSFLRGEFPIEKQLEVEHLILERFGFDSANWRLGETTHPFASGPALTDIRITTKHHLEHLHSLFSTMHEFGHGLYERQVDPKFRRSPLARGTSLAIHESQSRMWENLVGRSRAFWRHFYPTLQGAFPANFGNVDLEDFYRAVNKVQPNLIRIDSDEATYNLHIILRFELEQEMLAGAIDLGDLPEAWNVRMRDYLGVVPPDDSDGVLQDMHWASGSIGYFSTYSLGNIVSCQLWERITAEIPELEEQFERGEFSELREWLGENIHRYGRKYMPKELLQRVVGSGLDSGPYLTYLRSKLGEIYGLVAA